MKSCRLIAFLNQMHSLCVESPEPYLCEMMTHKHTFVSRFPPKPTIQVEDESEKNLKGKLDHTRVNLGVNLSELQRHSRFFSSLCLLCALRRTSDPSWQRSIHTSRSPAFMTPLPLLCTANTRWGSCLLTSSPWQTSVTAACGRDTTASASSSGGRERKKKAQLQFRRNWENKRTLGTILISRFAL